jgi:hypothetical protein
VRVQERDDRRSAGLSPTTPTVHIDVCRCGSTHDAGTPHESPDWPLASAWAYLTRPVDDVPVPDELDEAGVLLRALWEVLQTPPGPVA